MTENHEWAGCGGKLCKDCEYYEKCRFAPNLDDDKNDERSDK